MAAVKSKEKKNLEKEENRRNKEFASTWFVSQED